ncbi:hypothetical protein [Allomuricauda sp. SCSIO 65647]|uniref:hypothetical protein n=1 Tax=Allomuricauda sp. SCSIO 65647 TaxID=2908843 RepID=UPI001F2EA92B|nr:hypothetical protein [Muricauda sp. SCSIO 65647]UJH68813.1 hypothetical protein L0P89_06240 [Muricauda sp. SCSIO 65647]
MNRFSIFLVIIIFTFGCKEKNSGKEKAESKNSLRNTERKSDFHPLIDLILDRVHPDEVERYNLEILIDSSLIPRLTNFPPDFDKRLNDSIKIKLLKSFKNRISAFELDTSKLNPKSRTLLEQQVDKVYKIRIVFNGFLEIKEDGLAATTIGFYYSPKGGWEEIVIFEKKDGIWNISNRIETVNY